MGFFSASPFGSETVSLTPTHILIVVSLLMLSNPILLIYSGKKGAQFNFGELEKFLRANFVSAQTNKVSILYNIYFFSLL
jgi:hypothetical protein